MANITANMDSVFDGVSDNQLDFDTIFDSEDSLIDTVEGTNESGIPITTAMAIDSLRESGFMDEADLLTDVNKSEGDGKVPDEPTTDEGTGKNQSPEGTENDPKKTYNDDNEGMKSAVAGTGNSSESKANCDKAAETALSNESADLDTLLGEADDLDNILGESDDFPDEAGQKKQDQEIEDKQKSDAQDAADANAQRAEAQSESYDLDNILGESDDDAAGDASDDGSDEDDSEVTEDADFNLDTILGESDDDTDTSDDTSDDDTEECTKEDAEPKDEGILADDDSREGDDDTKCTDEEVDLDVVLGSPETKTDSSKIAQSCPDCVPNGDSNLDDAEGAAKGTDLDELLGDNEEGIKKSQTPGDHQDVMDLTDDEKKLSESIVVDWSNTHVLSEDDVHDMAKEDDTTDDDDVALADSPDPKSTRNLDYRAGEDDELIDLAMADNE